MISALDHLSKVVNWWYTEDSILVKTLSHVISALKHLNNLVNCCDTEAVMPLILS